MTSVISAQPSPPLAESPTTVAATAVPVCAAFLEDAYDAYGKTAEAQDSPINEDDTSHTVWHLLTTIYLPILFLRFRRSFFGFANFVLLGLRFLVTYLPMESLSQSPWFVTGAAKADQNSWPPPTLTVLAILTIFAFVVHPDGMTWIMLGKLRYVPRSRGCYFKTASRDSYIYRSHRARLVIALDLSQKRPLCIFAILHDLLERYATGFWDSTDTSSCYNLCCSCMSGCDFA